MHFTHITTEIIWMLKMNIIEIYYNLTNSIRPAIAQLVERRTVELVKTQSDP